MLKLYDYPDCPFCQKVRVVLAEKDLEYEKVFVDLRKQDQKQPEFLRMNLYGKVPVLTDEDEVIYDSTIINEYLEDEYPLPRLMPDDSNGRARVRMLEDYCDNSFIPPTTTLLAQLRKPDAERDAQRVEQARDELRRALYHLRDRLGDHEYLVGREFSIADAAFAPRIMVLGRLGIEIVDLEGTSCCPDPIYFKAKDKLSWLSIAAQYGVSVDEVIRYNTGEVRPLFISDTIRIPNTSPAPPSPTPNPFPIANATEPAATGDDKTISIVQAVDLNATSQAFFVLRKQQYFLSITARDTTKHPLKGARFHVTFHYSRGSRPQLTEATDTNGQTRFAFTIPESQWFGILTYAVETAAPEQSGSFSSWLFVY